MAQITRPTKTAGTTQYSTEVTAGATTIKASEVDADLNTAYGGVNAIDDSQIVAGAGIQGSKLADASITPAKLQPIPYSGLVLTGGIVNADINPTAAIAGSKLGAGAATRQIASASPAPALTISNVEGLIVTLPAFTVFGGLLELSSFMVLAETNAVQPALATGTFRWYRKIGVGAFTLILSVDAQWGFAATGGPAFTPPFLGVYPVSTPPLFDATPTVGQTVIYELRAITTTAQSFFRTTAANPGVCYIVERR